MAWLRPPFELRLLFDRLSRPLELGRVPAGMAWRVGRRLFARGWLARTRRRDELELVARRLDGGHDAGGAGFLGACQQPFGQRRCRRSARESWQPGSPA